MDTIPIKLTFRRLLCLEKGSDSHELIMAQIRDVEAYLDKFREFMYAAAVESSPAVLSICFRRLPPQRTGQTVPCAP